MIYSRVKLIVLEISPWMFNANAIDFDGNKMYPTPLLNQWGTIRERLTIKKMSQRIQAITINIVPRNPLSKYIAPFQDAKPIFELPKPEYHENLKALDQLRNDPKFMVKNISRTHLNEFKLYQDQANTLAELIKKINSFGVEVILVHPPVRSDYYDYFDIYPMQREEFEKYKSFIKSFSDKHQVIYWETPVDCGLDDSIFVDYGHLSKEGAILFTKRLSTEIKKAIK